MSNQLLNFKILKCKQSDHFTGLVTLIKKSTNKKVMVFSNERKVNEYFVDILDYMKIESTCEYGSFINNEFKLCFIDKTFDFDTNQLDTEFILFFDLPKIEIIEKLLFISKKSDVPILVVFLVRECENKWCEDNLIEKLNAQELKLPKSAMVEVESVMKKGTTKVFSLQRDAQLAYKEFMKSYAVNGHSHLKELVLKEVVKNFGLDIPPKINDFDQLLNKNDNTHTSVMRKTVQSEVPTKLRKIR